jgi:hypothetical protein
VTDWPKLKELDRLVLREGPGDGVVLPIAPTMRYITYGGERYFRMDKSRAHIDGGMAGAYLWDRYWDYVLFFGRLASLPWSWAPAKVPGSSPKPGVSRRGNE